jgi:hypothetical protein
MQYFPVAATAVATAAATTIATATTTHCPKKRPLDMIIARKVDIPFILRVKHSRDLI